MARPKKLNHPPTTNAEALKEVTIPEIVEEPIVEEIIKPDKKLYRSIRFNMYHPFQFRHLTTDAATELFMDGWLESQINAGLVEEWQ